MSFAIGIAFLIFACIVPLYLYACFRLHRIVQAERPEWLDVPSSFANLPGPGDANVQFEVLRIAFGSRVSQLDSPKAAIYAQRIRVMLWMAIPIFLVALAASIARES
jgi:hypothetical protein